VRKSLFSDMAEAQNVRVDAMFYGDADIDAERDAK